MALSYSSLVLSPGEKDAFLFHSLRIVRVTAGQCLWQIGDRQFRLSTGDIVFLNDRTPRRILQSRNLILDVFELQNQDLAGSPILLQAFYGNRTAVCNADPLLCETLNLLRSALKSDEASNYIKHLFSAAVCLLEKAFPAQATTQPSQIAFHAADYIWHHFATDISVSQLAAALSISKNHLESCFRQVHGIGVGGYIRLIRLHHVQLLLRESERSVLDIALSCGFRSSSGFYKAYKAVYGTAPRTVR